MKDSLQERCEILHLKYKGFELLRRLIDDACLPKLERLSVEIALDENICLSKQEQELIEEYFQHQIKV